MTGEAQDEADRYRPDTVAWALRLVSALCLVAAGIFGDGRWGPVILVLGVLVLMAWAWLLRREIRTGRPA